MGLVEGLNDFSKEFSGKVVIVTGATNSNGIGAAIAQEFARQGADGIVLPHRVGSRAKTEGVAQQIADCGPAKIVLTETDITDEDASKKVARDVRQNYKGLELGVLVNNAGVLDDAPTLTMTRQKWNSVLDVVARGAFEMSQQAARLMLRNGGAIVNIGSIVGVYGNRGQINYAAAKGALESMTRVLAQELGGNGIRVNIIHPGFIRTNMTAMIDEEAERVICKYTPLGRIGSPSDVACLTTFLASPRATFMTGQAINLDGGLGGQIHSVYTDIARRRKGLE